ncbi:septum-promoting GTP-binding protein 1-like isoform X1 [Arachis duranensis]|uniref:Septum-promoting GTP-binding protein 1-like isoform X1 n=1 Tax=Arachis duranensis TaxID=130453 RepID=A0A6P4BYV4_ARADU|nr:septum-promoting GTP-binding protein 1-like isoform X1 [Arachis duranensis]
MFQLRRSVIRGSLCRRIQHRISILRRYIHRLFHHFLLCSPPSLYRRMLLPSSSSSSAVELVEPVTPPHQLLHTHDMDSDLVSLKISLLGDSHIGKTSFLMKYVGAETEKDKKQGEHHSKTLIVEGARISYSIWEIAGDEKSEDQIPLACKDSVAILIMFDLTSRCTLNSVIGWYKEARKWNRTAIPVLVGTKFDDFIQLPIDMQWTIASQARAYAKALNATLFFSSATYNINVNKVFKFITAKLFDLPWTLERNLNVGEPIIDF